MNYDCSIKKRKGGEEVVMETINFVEMLVERVKGQGILGANHSDDERECDVIAMIEDCYATFEAIKKEVANDI